MSERAAQSIEIHVYLSPKNNVLTLATAAQAASLVVAAHEDIVKANDMMQSQLKCFTACSQLTTEILSIAEQRVKKFGENTTEDTSDTFVLLGALQEKRHTLQHLCNDWKDGGHACGEIRSSVGRDDSTKTVTEPENWAHCKDCDWDIPHGKGAASPPQWGPPATPTDPTMNRPYKKPRWLLEKELEKLQAGVSLAPPWEQKHNCFWVLACGQLNTARSQRRSLAWANVFYGP